MRLVSIPVLSLLSALASCATPMAQSVHVPEIALTFDDLPVHGPIPQGQSPQSVGRDLIIALTRAHVPAYGFINARWTVEQPETLDILKDWRAAGLFLGNHTWSHRHLSEMTVEEFDQEIARNEPVLQQLGSGSDWRWFRYPFLDEGKDKIQVAAARQVLAARGYKIADVTMDFGDWQWTAPYARCLAAHDDASIAALQRMYISAARDAISFSRNLAHRLYGRDVPYVILLHESAFEARMIPQLIGLFRTAGFRFVGLPVAESDPYYNDRIHPQLAAGPEGLVKRALAAGLKLPLRPDYGPKLGSMCSTTDTQTTP